VEVENCRHMVVGEICTQSLEKESNTVLVVENCRHMVVEEICN
jgi:hypothetical protein